MNETEGNNPSPRQTIFNNYGTVGAQRLISGGTINVHSRKRAAANTLACRTKKKGLLYKPFFLFPIKIVS